MIGNSIRKNAVYLVDMQAPKAKFRPPRSSPWYSMRNYQYPSYIGFATSKPTSMLLQANGYSLVWNGLLNAL